jgi:ATP-dependent helicase/nuclease subunit A
MSRIELTPDQKSAVYKRSSSILVSAAAGSGKTRVLTERLMAYVTDNDNPSDIRSFLIITYTRAAASELRGRILEELSLRASQEPENRRLRRQSTLCYHAQIGTIHSFCTSLLREYCHKTGLSPDFRVGDEDKCAELREKALEKVMEASYEHVCDDSDFALLVESVGAGRDDSRLARTVLDLHGKMQSHPYPEKWAQQLMNSSDSSDCADAGETVWGRELMENAKRTTLYWTNRLDEMWFSLTADKAFNQPLISAYGDSLCETTEALRSLYRALDIGWDRARAELPIPFPRLKPLKNYDFEDRKLAFTSTRDSCKKSMEALCSVFDAPSEKLLRELNCTAPAMRALVSLTLEFDRQYSAEKRRHNLLDFSDLEHFAVKLLCNSETGGPTDTATEISKRYTEIMVDEYQDVNAVQDLIFQSISRNGKNVFMVGDVKQSIYRFRLADPSIFIKKYQSYEDIDLAADNEPGKILLQSNFRSDRAILGACNHVFSNTMSEALGEIDYDENAALFPPKDAPPRRGKTCLKILAVPQAEEGEERPDKTYLEARMVAKSIKELVEGSETILEGGVERPIKCSDIAILLRSPGTAGAAFAQALFEYGIPVLAEQGGGFFKSSEILIVMSLLSVIDNPHRDIPLTAVLASPVFSFTAEELSLIRASDRESDFFTALTKAAAESEKCAAFLKTLSEIRAISSDIGICELLSLIYDRLELPALFASSPGSGTNLILLLDYAAAFEKNGYRGLFDFLKQLKRMEERGDEPSEAIGSVSQAVSIMSIHKSKGLEYPIVFLANTSRRFNTLDLRAPVLVHPELGLGCKVTDTSRGLEYPTLARRAIASRLNTEMLSEEMRVLYVAMTRAKERLYISCAAKDPDALIAKLSQNLSSPMNPEILKSAPSMSHWLISAALIENGGLIELKTKYPSEDEALPEGDTETLPTEMPEIDSAKLSELSSLLNYRYSYEKSVKLPTKLTATELPDEEKDADAKPLLSDRRKAFRLPDFAGDKRPLSGAEAGTATHIAMQFIDFARTDTIAGIEGEIARVSSLGLLTKRQAMAVDSASILRFFSSETGKRILNADVVSREKRFSLLCPAEEFFKDAEGENVLLQGVVDCLIEERGEIYVIDYKTDYVTPDTLSSVTERYAKQLHAYAYAMSRLMKKPVKGSLLCFLRSGLVAEVENK